MKISNIELENIIKETLNKYTNKITVSGNGFTVENINGDVIKYTLPNNRKSVYKSVENIK